MKIQGTVEELRAAAFAAKEVQRKSDAHASPEEKFAMLEAMQELADELVRARDTMKSPPAKP